MNIVWRLVALTIGLLLIVGCGQDQKQEAKSDDSALNDLTRLVNNDPDNASLYMERGRYLYQQESYDAAIADIRKAIDIDSTQPPYYHLLSDIYLDYYQSKNAIRTLTQAEKLFPDDIKTKLKLSEDYLILKDYDNALIFAHMVRNLDPLNAEAFFMLGLINQENGNTDFAISSFKKAVEYEPELIDGWIILGDLLESKDDPNAIDYYNAAIEIDRNNISALHSKAFYLQNKNQEAQAITIYESIKKLNRQYEPAYLNTGILYLDQDSVTQAYDQFNILVNNNPISDQGFYYRGIANELLGKEDLAIEDYKTALRINPDHAKARAAVQSSAK